MDNIFIATDNLIELYNDFCSDYESERIQSDLIDFAMFVYHNLELDKVDRIYKEQPCAESLIETLAIETITFQILLFCVKSEAACESVIVSDEFKSVIQKASIVYEPIEAAKVLRHTLDYLNSRVQLENEFYIFNDYCLELLNDLK